MSMDTIKKETLWYEKSILKADGVCTEWSPLFKNITYEYIFIGLYY